MRAAVTLLLLLLFGAGHAGAADDDSSCKTCHYDPDLFDEETAAEWLLFEEDVHAEIGLSCVDCHGGDPDPRLAEDADAAMDPESPKDPFRGVPERVEIPAFCGRCHSDPEYMKRFRPDPRVDQETEYRTSHHGKALAAGDTKVATCIDCHGIHHVLRPGNSESPVHPRNVGNTCGLCHADATRMAGYALPDGRPLPIDQLARWNLSVHAKAMFEKDDLSAPTCNDCHGNHGAAPPGLSSVSLVCGQCHGRESELFRASPKRSGFADHNEFLQDAAEEGCGACHDPEEPQTNIIPIHSFTECATCHDNHAVIRPTVALLGLLPETPCAFCHEGPGAPVNDESQEPKKVRTRYYALKDLLLAETEGLGEAERFDRLVDHALALSTHTVTPGSDGDGTPTLRPEFARLFEKFRIGKIHYTYPDPAGGEDIRARVVQCTDCHGSDPALADGLGFDTAQEYVRQMRELTSRIARAERTLLAAHRGGVHVRDALFSLDGAIDSQIELEVLVHTFAVEEDGAFMIKHAEGIEHAELALEAGSHGLKELRNRRYGLMIALVFITFTLIGLGMKIRGLSPGT